MSMRPKPEHDPETLKTHRKIQARAELLSNIRCETSLFAFQVVIILSTNQLTSLSRHRHLEESLKNEKFNTKLAKSKLKQLRKIAIQQEDDLLKQEKVQNRLKQRTQDPANPYYGRRRGEGIHTGKDARVELDYVDKVRFEVDPQFKRSTKFTQEWYARHTSAPITRDFRAPKTTSDISKVGVDAGTLTVYWSLCSITASDGLYDPCLHTPALSYQMGNRLSPLRDHRAGKVSGSR